MENNNMAFDKAAYWANRKKGLRGQGVMAKLGFTPHGKGNAPIDLGIKQYKREHSNESKRVLYFKQEMWKAFHELKGEAHGH
jgi:hypothetical protein